jgi:predicted nucleic acid-binding protein
MRIYLDTCTLQRPLDSRSQIRISVEAEAVLGILSICDAGSIDLVSSDVLIFETDRNPNPIRREYGLEVLSKATVFAEFTDGLEQRARELNALGIRPLDALHLASAVAAEADFLCTCDDRFLRKGRELRGLRTKVVSPVEIIEEIERWQQQQGH